MVLRLSAVCGASGAAIRDGGGQHRPSVVRGRPLRRGQAVRNRPGGFQVRHRGESLNNNHTTYVANSAPTQRLNNRSM
eukprot:1566763-Pyramimonas_sp.AAC.2